MTSGPGAPSLPPPEPPAAAARAVSQAARAAADAWAQPMDPGEHSRALGQLHSVLRDLGIATRGLVRYQTAGYPSDPAVSDFPRLLTTSAELLLGASERLYGVLAAEGLRGLPDPEEPGAMLCKAARIAITAWRQPVGTSAERDAAIEGLVTAVGYLAVATRNLMTWAPRQRTIDLHAVGTSLTGVTACLSQAIAAPQATQRPDSASSDPPDRRPLVSEDQVTNGEAARLISSAARDAALAWAQPLPEVTGLNVAWDLHRTFYYLGITLQRLSRFQQNPEPDGPAHTRLHEPGTHIYRAGSAIVNAGIALRDHEALQHVRHNIAAASAVGGDPQDDQAAITSVLELADATASAYRMLDGMPSGTTADRDAAVEAFMSVLDSLDTAVENLALRVPRPHSAIFTATRTRLEQACTQLREALVCSAVDFRQAGSGQQVVAVREGHPVLPHRSQPAPDAPFNHAATLAQASFPLGSVPQASAPRTTSPDLRQPRRTGRPRRMT
jgi:hypothetical protein